MSPTYTIRVQRLSDEFNGSKTWEFEGAGFTVSDGMLTIIDATVGGNARTLAKFPPGKWDSLEVLTRSGKTAEA